MISDLVLTRPIGVAALPGGLVAAVDSNGMALITKNGKYHSVVPLQHFESVALGHGHDVFVTNGINAQFLSFFPFAVDVSAGTLVQAQFSTTGGSFWSTPVQRHHGL